MAADDEVDHVRCQPAAEAGEEERFVASRPAASYVKVSSPPPR
jgi:hypothetical protein